MCKFRAWPLVLNTSIEVYEIASSSGRGEEESLVAIKEHLASFDLHIEVMPAGKVDHGEEIVLDCRDMEYPGENNRSALFPINDWVKFHRPNSH